MVPMKRTVGWLGPALLLVFLAPSGRRVTADPPESHEVPGESGEALPPAVECRVIDLEMQPTAGLQIVAWFEDTEGNYIDTIFITSQTGSFGLGNRPGVFGMKSGPNWPYGPRDDVFPVWSHRHGMQWKKVRFRNGDGLPGGAIDCQDVTCKNDPDRNLSHRFDESSEEHHFSRPLKPDEVAWDVGSGASQAFTDKGTQLPGGPYDQNPELGQLWSRYPPRDDLVYDASRDWPDVLEYDDQNPFDAVSQATPIGGAPYRYSWLIPPELYTSEPKDYVMFVEVSKEFDTNAYFNSDMLLTATAAGWNEYGLPYRGQPSVIYRVPFQIGPDESRTMTAEIVGYGDPEGQDGEIRPPTDGRMTMDAPGSGALRLAVVNDEINGETYQVRVDARFETDGVAPGRVGPIVVGEVSERDATIELTAPGDDDMIGHAAGYDVRYRVGEEITYANFSSSQRALPSPEPEASGTRQTVAINGLLPATSYYVAVRAYDSCRNYGPIEVTQLTTLDRVGGEVDACFVATAAYGSLMANDVQALRRFRDVALRSNVVGELAVEAYYTFGPGLATFIGESELLRSTARELLAPFVAKARTVTP
jgi:hypothetical protein